MYKQQQGPLQETTVTNFNNSISKSKRYLRWLRRRVPRRTGSTPASAPPRRLNIIFDLKME
jgi:hypothetical protein